MRYILLLCLSLFLTARENPFIPTNQMDEKKIEATNIKPDIEDFKQQRITMPNDARILKYIILGYQAIDGSIKEKNIKVDKNIDWHESLNLVSKETFAPPVVIEPIKANHKQIVQKTKKIEIKTPKKTLHVKTSSFKIKPYISFDVSKNRLIIHTNDKLLRDFQVSKPYKLALDFKRPSAFYTKNIFINHPPFKKLQLGAHKSFYRLSFLLDGPYIYSIKKESGKIIVILK